MIGAGKSFPLILTPFWFDIILALTASIFSIEVEEGPTNEKVFMLSGSAFWLNLWETPLNVFLAVLVSGSSVADAFLEVRLS